jgi:hypothetical protein
MASRKPRANEKTVYAVNHNSYVSPRIEDDAKEKWITWGRNNSYWRFLTELSHNSPSNGACLNGIFRLVYGDGLHKKDGSTPIDILARLSERDLQKTINQFVKTNKITLQVEYNVSTDETEGVKKSITGVFFEAGEKFALGKKNTEGEITTIYYCEKSWEDRRTTKLAIPAFGFGSDTDEVEIFYYEKPHDNNAYYGPVDYQAGLQYAELEVETANYHINMSHNGFTPSALINLNNGIPDANTRKDIIQDIVGARTGSSNAGKIVVLFNRDSGSAASIEPYSIPDAHKQYEFISKESMEKIFLSHNITSPLLLGIRDTGGGLGSNSDEMRQAYNLFNLMVLEPIRQNIIEALKMIFPKESVNLEFKQFDFFTKELEAKPEQPKPNVAMSEQMEMTNSEQSFFITELEKYGEKIDDDEFVLIGEQEAGSMEDEESYLSSLRTHADVPSADSDQPQDKSKQDSGLYMVRYSYGPQKASTDSRDFCKFMVSAAESGVVYRMEDIAKMSQEGVNGQFAPQGRTFYDLWRYKGGSYCHHRWFRRVYFRKRNNKGTFDPRSKTPQLENEERVSIASAKKAGVPSSKLEPTGTKKSETRPIDMPYGGSLKNR